MKSYEYDCDDWTWAYLKVFSVALGIGFTLLFLALLAKVAVDTWTGGCIG